MSARRFLGTRAASFKGREGPPTLAQQISLRPYSIKPRLSLASAQPSIKLKPKLFKKRKTDSLPYPFHRVKVEVQIVIAGQNAGQDLSADVQMPQISSAITDTYGAFALF